MRELLDQQQITAAIAANQQWGLTLVRPEQGIFRQQLLEAYDHRCCITGTRIAAILEAAHVIPFREGGTGINTLENGLLLRADLHRLFDSLLLKVDPETMTVTLAAEAENDPFYASLKDRSVRADMANRARLRQHFPASIREDGGVKIERLEDSVKLFSQTN